MTPTFPGGPRKRGRKGFRGISLVAPNETRRAGSSFWAGRDSLRGSGGIFAAFEHQTPRGSEFGDFARQGDSTKGGYAPLSQRDRKNKGCSPKKRGDLYEGEGQGKSRSLPPRRMYTAGVVRRGGLTRDDNAGRTVRGARRSRGGRRRAAFGRGWAQGGRCRRCSWRRR
jgi:hypothetical protein